MREPHRKWGHTYRLVLSDDGREEPRTIEFEAACPDTALHVAHQVCRGREAELFEDERSLGRIRCMQAGGYWVLSPSPGAAGAN